MLIGVDVGGTKMLGVAGSVDTAHDGGAVRVDVKSECRVPTPQTDDALVKALIGVVRTLERDSGDALTAVAVGIAGLIDRRGVVRFSPHLPDVVELPLADQLRHALHCPVAVENDVTTATLAEAHMGAGRGCRDLVVVALGTGIGTKFLVDGALVRGANGFAGESGHMTVDRNGAPHVTGLAGAWEMYGSGTGLGDLAQRCAEAGDAPTLVAMAGTADSVTGETVAAAVAAGHADALAVLDAYAEQVAIGIANLIVILDPQRIVLGGGVSAIGEPLRARVEAAAQRRVVGASHRPLVPVVLAELGEQAGALGAVLAARDAAEGASTR